MAVTREGRPTQKIRTIFVLHPIPYMAYFSFFLFFPNWRVFTEGLSIILCIALFDVKEPTKQGLKQTFQSTSYHKVNSII